MSAPPPAWLGRWSLGVPLATLVLGYATSQLSGVSSALDLDDGPLLALSSFAVLGTIGTVVSLRRTIEARWPATILLGAVATPWLLAVAVHLWEARNAARAIANADVASMCVMALRGQAESLGATIVGAETSVVLAIAAVIVLLRARRALPDRRDLSAIAALAALLAVLALIVSAHARIEARTHLSMMNADVASRPLLFASAVTALAVAAPFALLGLGLTVAWVARTVSTSGLGAPARAPELGALVAAVLVPLALSVAATVHSEREALVDCEAPWAAAPGFRPLRIGEPLEVRDESSREILLADARGLSWPDGTRTTALDLFARARARREPPFLVVAPDRRTPAHVLRTLVVAAQEASLTELTLVGLDVDDTVAPSFPWLPAAHAAITHRAATVAFSVPPWGWQPEPSYRTIVARVGREPGTVRRFVDGTPVDLAARATAEADEIADPNGEPLVILSLDDDATAGSLLATMAPVAGWLGWQPMTWVLVPGALPRPP